MNKLTCKTLRTIARLLGLAGCSRKTKAQLIAALKGAGDGLAHRTVRQLHQAAKLLGLAGLSRARKAILVRAIYAVLDPHPCMTVPGAARVTTDYTSGFGAFNFSLESLANDRRQPIAEDYAGQFVSLLIERLGHMFMTGNGRYREACQAEADGTATAGDRGFIRTFRASVVAKFQAGRACSYEDVQELIDELAARGCGRPTVAQVEGMVA